MSRWFCEGRELHNCPDVHIWRDGDLYTLMIAEAFEEDTGRYTCVASNSLGADNTSAEVYIEGECIAVEAAEGRMAHNNGWKGADGMASYTWFPLILLQPLPGARPPQLRCHQPPVVHRYNFSNISGLTVKQMNVI